METSARSFQPWVRICRGDEQVVIRLHLLDPECAPVVRLDQNVTLLNCQQSCILQLIACPDKDQRRANL